MLEIFITAKEEHARRICNITGMNQILHGEKARNALTMLFIDCYLKRSKLLPLVELTKEIGGNCDKDVVD